MPHTSVRATPSPQRLRRDPVVQFDEGRNMKRVGLLLVLSGLSTACGGGGKITDLPLVWSGVKKPPPASPAVAAALKAVPIEPGEFKDGRTTPPNVVGTYQSDGYIVTTKGDVRAFWAGHERILLEHAGAKFQTPGGARLDATLLQLDVLEGDKFNGTARVSFTVTTRASAPWTKAYEGKVQRWGRTHKPDNFDEALSNAIAEVTKQLLNDEAFALALEGKPVPAPLATPPVVGKPL